MCLYENQLPISPAALTGQWNPALLGMSLNSASDWSKNPAWWTWNQETTEGSAPSVFNWGAEKMPVESSHSRAISRFKLFGDITMVISPALLTQSVTSSRRPPNALDTLHQTASPCLRLLHGAPQQKAVLGRVGRCKPSHRCRSLKEADAA